MKLLVFLGFISRGGLSVNHGERCMSWAEVGVLSSFDVLSSPPTSCFRATSRSCCSVAENLLSLPAGNGRAFSVRGEGGGGRGEGMVSKA